jgi:hypothetical protein
MLERKEIYRETGVSSLSAIRTRRGDLKELCDSHILQGELTMSRAAVRKVFQEVIFIDCMHVAQHSYGFRLLCKSSE